MESVVRCIEMGAADYLPKPFNTGLLQARISACLEKKRLVDQERRTFQALKESQDALAAELAEAARYVQALLPPPVEAEVSIDWRFIPSTQLGGDAFGYRWLDQDHLALYLLDVCGHGVGAALLSVSVLNILLSERACAADLRDPGVVLEMLNDAFPMERHHAGTSPSGTASTIAGTRTLEYATGGHPPAVLVTSDCGAERAALVHHPEPGLVIGAMPDMR